METLVHTCHCTIAGQKYEVFIFRRSDGSHVAKTIFTPADVIINDGASLEEVLARHQRLLPLAVNSRELLHAARRSS
jgi:hypothetical protein